MYKLNAHLIGKNYVSFFFLKYHLNPLMKLMLNVFEMFGINFKCSYNRISCIIIVPQNRLN